MKHQRCRFMRCDITDSLQKALAPIDETIDEDPAGTLALQAA